MSDQTLTREERDTLQMIAQMEMEVTNRMSIHPVAVDFLLSSLKAAEERAERAEETLRHYRIHPADLLTEIRDAALTADDAARGDA